MTTPDAASRCADLTHCITCSDALELVRLDTISDDHAVGICADVKGIAARSYSSSFRTLRSVHGSSPTLALRC